MTQNQTINNLPQWIDWAVQELKNGYYTGDHKLAKEIQHDAIVKLERVKELYTMQMQTILDELEKRFNEFTDEAEQNSKEGGDPLDTNDADSKADAIDLAIDIIEKIISQNRTS